MTGSLRFAIWLRLAVRAPLPWRARSTGRRFTGPSPFARFALEHIGEPIKAPVLSPARDPRACEEAFGQTPPFGPLAPPPEPAFELDPRVTW